MTKVRVGGKATVSERGTIRAIGTYVSTFDPALGLPTNGSGPGGMILKGDYWKASGAGTISGLTPFTVFASDDLIYAAINNALNAVDFFGNKGTGSGGGGGAVDSVNGQTGVVVLDAGDVGADVAGSAAVAQAAAIASANAYTNTKVLDSIVYAIALG